MCRRLGLAPARSSSVGPNLAMSYLNKDFTMHLMVLIVINNACVPVACVDAILVRRACTLQQETAARTGPLHRVYTIVCTVRVGNLVLWGLSTGSRVHVPGTGALRARWCPQQGVAHTARTAVTVGSGALLCGISAVAATGYCRILVLSLSYAACCRL